MNNKMIKRRDIAKGLVAAPVAAASLPAPAIASGKIRWSMVTTWPRNFPGLGTGANVLAETINAASDGRMEVTVYGAGEIVPAFDAIDAVANGTAEMGHGTPFYWKGKVPAAQFIGTIPFGLTAQEQNAWFAFGGGQELADTVSEQMGCKVFVSGNTGVQTGGWYNKEIKSVADFDGLKIRMPGLGGEVLKTLGATVVNRAGGELLTSMQSGDIDAVEWVAPYNDMAFGFHKVAKHCYVPGWHEPATILDNFINMNAWSNLPSDLQGIVSVANQAANAHVLSEFTARNAGSYHALVSDHGVEMKHFPDTMLAELGSQSGRVLNDLADKDALSRKVLDSLIDFRKGAMSWTARSEQAYTNARALPYSYFD